MKVVDGMHRVLAARMRGDTRISARFFQGDEQDAFLLSIILNRRHGLPLTRADRAAAVERILRSHPEWSDRALAALAGGQPFLSADFSLHVLDVSLRLSEGRGVTEDVPLLHADDAKLARDRATALGGRS